MKNPLIRWTVLLLIGLIIGLGIAYTQKEKALEGEVTELETASILKKPVSAPIEGADVQSDIGGSFTLVDQDGKTVTQENYKDFYKLIFFGFTYCPAVCPTELQKVQKVMDGLGESSAKIQPVLISIDPARDTPQRLKEYVAQFHPRQIGLTGSMEQIDAVKNAYKVYANKVDMGSLDNYMMDHSAFLYLMSPDDTLVAIYPSSETADKIIEDMKAKGF